VFDYDKRLRKDTKSVKREKYSRSIVDLRYSFYEIDKVMVGLKV